VNPLDPALDFDLLNWWLNRGPGTEIEAGRLEEILRFPDGLRKLEAELRGEGER
jgi:hypothetical protein